MFRYSKAYFKVSLCSFRPKAQVPVASIGYRDTELRAPVHPIYRVQTYRSNELVRFHWSDGEDDVSLANVQILHPFFLPDLVQRKNAQQVLSNFLIVDVQQPVDVRDLNWPQTIL
jgi:hypothetical protein